MVLREDASPSDTMPLLTIAIPTYNRNQILLGNLQRLLPQLTPQCRLLIVDNCSDVPVAETLRELLDQALAVDWTISRNRTNIGGNANILRCFELCETEWLWVLGDDDQVHPDAIATICAHIATHPACLLFNFACDGLRPRTVLTRGLEELVAKLDRSADIPWTSSSIYRADKMLAQLKFGYQYTYALLPHVALVLVTIADTGLCCLSREPIVAKQRLGVPLEQQWSLLNLALGFPTLLDLPLTPQVREGLARKLLATNQSEGIHFRSLVYQLLLLAVKDRDHRSAVYYYDQICHRRYYFDRGPRRKAERFGYRLVLRFPQLTMLIFRLVKGKTLSHHVSQDRYGRM
jgi:glycosyltransferase involved in cell wall biosynthesis